MVCLRLVGCIFASLLGPSAGILCPPLFVFLTSTKGPLDRVPAAHLLRSHLTLGYLVWIDIRYSSYLVLTPFNAPRAYTPRGKRTRLFGTLSATEAASGVGPRPPFSLPSTGAGGVRVEAERTPDGHREPRNSKTRRGQPVCAHTCTRRFPPRVALPRAHARTPSLPRRCSLRARRYASRECART